MPLVLVLVLGQTASCAEGTLDSVDPVLGDVPGSDASPEVALDDAAATDGPVVDATLPDANVVDVPSVDVPKVTVDVPMIDAATVDLPANDDVPPVVDGPTEFTDTPAAADVGVDSPPIPTDTGWGEGPTGYRVVRDEPASRWINACAQPGHQTVLVDADDGSFRAALPFRFRFWGLPLAEGAPVVVSPNGYLTFQPAAATPANGVIPSRLDGVDAVIAAQWRDLRTRSPGVCLAVLDNLGARRWVIQWSDARYFTSALGHLNFQVVLNEGSNAIDFVYDQMTLPEPATVALENWDGTRSSVPFTIPQPIVFSNTRARFVPQ